MEALTKLAIVALVVVATIGSGPKVANADICGMTFDQIMSCKPAVAAPDSLPSARCCSALKKADPPCLCQYQSYLPSFDIDPKLAMQLPEKCKLENAKSFSCPS